MIRNFAIAARVILGLIFVVFGLNSFFHFFSLPPLSPRGMLFLQSIMGTGYLWPLLKITEIGCGLLLLLGVFVPLSLVMISPVIVNIVLFHMFLDRKGIPMAFAMGGMHLFLLWCYRSGFRSFFSSNNLK